MASKYPYPSEVNVGEFVTMKLSRANYPRWKLLMFSILKYEGLVGFVDGTFPVPPKHTSVQGIVSTNETTEYQDWKRSDRLVGRWILATVNDDLIEEVSGKETAEEMWKYLVETCSPFYGRKTIMAQIKELGSANLYRYKPLYNAVFYGKWETARKFIEQEPHSVKRVITTNGETVLMIAIRTAKSDDFVMELVDKMSPEDVALPNIYGSTALHEAAGTGNIEAAKLLVNKNAQLLYVLDKDRSLPLHYAASYGKKEMVRYLLEITEEDVTPRPFEDESGGRLMQHLISSALYDMALSLVMKYPKLAYWDISPLNSVAGSPSSFRSGTHLNLWQRIIYSCVPKNLENFVINHTNGGDVENPVINQSNEGDVANPVHSFISDQFVSVRRKIYGRIWKVAEVLVPQMKDIREMKLKHDQAVSFTRQLCLKISDMDYTKAWFIFGEAINTAATTGVSEVVEEIMVSFPEALTTTKLGFCDIKKVPLNTLKCR